MMDNTFWIKQSGKPAFPDMEWSQPENKRYAGKLLIVGGESHSFSIPAEAYGIAEQSGIGHVRVVLPEQVKKLVPEPMRPLIEFLPGLANGSFAKHALAELCDQAAWADTVMLAGGFGKNSETMALLERFAAVYKGPLAISDDAVQAFIQEPGTVLKRERTLLVVTLSELQKLARNTGVLITHSQQLTQLVEMLHQLSVRLPATIITAQNDVVLVAHQGKVSTTPIPDHLWRHQIAPRATVWWTQFPDQPFEAATTALIRK